MKILQFFPLSSLPYGEGINPCNDSDSPVMALTALPDSTIVKNGNPVYIPDFDSLFCARVYVAVKICRLGKSIARRFAYRYYEEIAPAVCISAETLLSSLRAQGLPWAQAMAFDKSCVLGEFGKYEMIPHFSLRIDGPQPEHLEFQLPDNEKIAEAIHLTSLSNTLKMGDLILLPVEPTAVIRLQEDSLIMINNGSDTLLSLPIR